MRQIKFRIWDSEKYMSLSKALNKGLVGVQFDRDDSFELEPYYYNVVIEQFTGLTDKNGVEIYEGDMVVKGGEKYIVEYVSCTIILSLIKCQGNGIVYLSGISHKTEVIGNIHEVANENKTR